MVNLVICPEVESFDINIVLVHFYTNKPSSL